MILWVAASCYISAVTTSFVNLSLHIVIGALQIYSINCKNGEVKGQKLQILAP
jgi:hypothetical protein